jgi:hypothetical protein
VVEDRLAGDPVPFGQDLGFHAGEVVGGELLDFFGS